MSFNARTFVFVASLAAMSACGGDETPSEECGVGEGCPCTSDFECPGFPTESCSAPFGMEGVCVVGGGDTDDDAGEDVEVDTGTDTADTSEPDTQADTVEDTEADTATDTQPDTVEDTAPDATDTSVDTADTGDPDTPADTDGSGDTDTTADTGEPDVDPGPPGGYYGWIAYQTTAGPGVGNVEIISGNGAVGPVRMPRPAGAASAEYPSFSPTGERLAYTVTTEDRSFIRIVTLATGEILDAFDGDFVAVRTPMFSPDERFLLFGAKTFENPLVWNLFVFDTDAESLNAISDITDENRNSSFVSGGAWSHDGTRVYYISGVPGDGSESNSDVWSVLPDGTDLESVTVLQNPTSIVVSVRPDGTEVLYDSRRTAAPVRWSLSGSSATSLGFPESDSQCVYYGSSPYALCVRHITDADERCREGDANCSQELVVLELESADLVRVITRAPDTRESFPAVTGRPYTELDLASF